jgi:hypothetical protein
MAKAFEILSLQVREKSWKPGKMPKQVTSLQRLFEDKWPDSVETWKKAGEEDESLMPALIGVSLKHGKLYAIMLPWRDASEKAAMKAFVAAVLQRYECDHYVFVSEVWLRKGHPDGTLVDHEDVKQDGMIQCGADLSGTRITKTMIRVPKAGGGFDYMDDPNEHAVADMTGDMLNFLTQKPADGYEVFESEDTDGPSFDDITAAFKAKTGWPL